VGPWGRWTPAFAGVTRASPSFLRKQESRSSFLHKQESRGPVGPVDPGFRRGDARFAVIPAQAGIQVVIPAQAGIPWGRWTPAFAGVTSSSLSFLRKQESRPSFLRKQESRGPYGPRLSPG
jgi:hypothetical protein